jgi:general secretion pathway protein K
MNAFGLTGSRQQRGVAAITAILVVALASILAVDLAWEMTLDMRRTENMLLRDQARQIALGAEIMAIDELRRDFEQDSESGEFCDDLTERWNTDITFPVDGGGTVRGKISDMQGRFNLNNLVLANGKNPETYDQFSRLLAALELDPEIAPKVLDWIDPNQIAEFGGAEDNVYTSKIPPYLAANTWMTTTTELLAIDGFVEPEDPDPALFKLLERYVAALPSGTKINVNTAEDPTLASFADPANLLNADPLKTNRPYCEVLVSDSNSSVAFMDDADGIVTPEFANAHLQVFTEYFQLKAAVTLGTTQLTMYSLLHRNPEGLVTTRLRYFDTK